MHTLVIKYDQLGIFKHNISYHACIHHTRHQVKYLMPNSFSRVRKYGDQLEARISALEHIKEKFGHEIREIKKELARLANW